MANDTYVPMNIIIREKEKHWTFTDINLSYIDIAKKGIVMWCAENLESRWTMLGGSKFGFEDPADAMMFKMQFGFN